MKDQRAIRQLCFDPLTEQRNLLTTFTCEGWTHGLTQVLTDVLLSAHHLQDGDLFLSGGPDLLDLLPGQHVRRGDVDDLHGVLLSAEFVDTPAHHTAHPPDGMGRDDTHQACPWRSSYILDQIVRSISGLCVWSWTPNIRSIEYTVCATLFTRIPFVMVTVKCTASNLH